MHPSKWRVYGSLVDTFQLVIPFWQNTQEIHDSHQVQQKDPDTQIHMPYFALYTFEALADLIVMPWGIFKTTVGRYKWYLQDKYVSVYLPGDYCSFRSSKLWYLFFYDTSMGTEMYLFICLFAFIWGRVKDGEEGSRFR